MHLPLLLLSPLLLLPSLFQQVSTLEATPDVLKPLADSPVEVYVHSAVGHTEINRQIEQCGSGRVPLNKRPHTLNGVASRARADGKSRYSIA